MTEMFSGRPFKLISPDDKNVLYCNLKESIRGRSFRINVRIDRASSEETEDSQDARSIYDYFINLLEKEGWTVEIPPRHVIAERLRKMNKMQAIFFESGIGVVKW